MRLSRGLLILAAALVHDAVAYSPASQSFSAHNHVRNAAGTALMLAKKNKPPDPEPEVELPISGVATKPAEVTATISAAEMAAANAADEYSTAKAEAAEAKKAAAEQVEAVMVATAKAVKEAVAATKVEADMAVAHAAEELAQEVAGANAAVASAAETAKAKAQAEAAKALEDAEAKVKAPLVSAMKAKAQAVAEAVPATHEQATQQVRGGAATRTAAARAAAEAKESPKAAYTRGTTSDGTVPGFKAVAEVMPATNRQATRQVRGGAATRIVAARAAAEAKESPKATYTLGTTSDGPVPGFKAVAEVPATNRQAKRQVRGGAATTSTAAARAAAEAKESAKATYTRGTTPDGTVPGFKAVAAEAVPATNRQAKPEVRGGPATRTAAARAAAEAKSPKGTYTRGSTSDGTVPGFEFGV